MTTRYHKLSLDEVIDEFFYFSDMPDGQRLSAAIDAYPEYREDLVEFASLWASYENTLEPVEEIISSTASDQSLSKLQSFVMNRLYELNQEGNETATDLDAAREALSKLAGNALRRAADAIGLLGSSALLQKVLNNNISDTPNKLLEALASYLHVSVRALNRALLERGMGGARSFKASNKPTVAQSETWAHAVNKIPLSDEQKKVLLTLQDKE